MGEATAILSPASRRGFLKAAAATAAGLTIGFHWSGPLSRALADTVAGTDKDFAPNAFLRIAPDNSVTVIAKHLEMGQGSYTGLATVVAEELDADWAQIRVESAPADASKYANLVFGTMQGTGGSSAMANSWMQLRHAGATARAMLVAAAATEWNVTPASLTVERGVVHHAPSNRQATFGALAGKASSLPVPNDVPLKDPKDFKLIGQKLPRVDIPAKTNGTAQFTIDVTFPDMLVAAAAASPAVRRDGEIVRRIRDQGRARRGRGAASAARRRRRREAFLGGEARARRARRRVAGEPKADGVNTDALLADYLTESAAAWCIEGRESVGDVVAGLSSATTKLVAEYDVPYLAHAPMEPLNCDREIDGDRCEIWTGTQFQTVDQGKAAASITGTRRSTRCRSTRCSLVAALVAARTRTRISSRRR